MEPAKSNLEPIDEKDLNLEGKFLGGKEKSFGENEKEGIFRVEKSDSQEKVAAEKDDAYARIMAKISDDSQAQALLDDDVADDARVASLKTDADSQISHLLDVAINKGVIHAVKVAKHLDDNYVLDSFHDKLLANEFHDALVAGGIIKEL